MELPSSQEVDLTLSQLEPQPVTVWLFGRVRCRGLMNIDLSQLVLDAGNRAYLEGTVGHSFYNAQPVQFPVSLRHQVPVRIIGQNIPANSPAVLARTEG